ncbi:MAG: hypothetical protein ABL884_00725 [Methyloglobulus sp.]
MKKFRDGWVVCPVYGFVTPGVLSMTNGSFGASEQPAASNAIKKIRKLTDLLELLCII